MTASDAEITDIEPTIPGISGGSSPRKEFGPRFEVPCVGKAAAGLIHYAGCCS